MSRGDARGTCSQMREHGVNWRTAELREEQRLNPRKKSTSLQVMTVLQQPRILFFYFILNTHPGKGSKYTLSCSTHGWKVWGNQVEANCLHSSVAFSALFAVSPLLLQVMMKNSASWSQVWKASTTITWEDAQNLIRETKISWPM